VRNSTQKKRIRAYRNWSAIIFKLSAGQEYTIEITPLVKRLSKVAKVQNADAEHKKSYADYLSKKYSK
jgi:hypothetical protein